MSELPPTEPAGHEHNWTGITVAGLGAMGMLGLAFKMVRDKRAAEQRAQQQPPEQPTGEMPTDLP